MMEPMSTTDELSEPLDMNLSPKNLLSHQIGTNDDFICEMPHLLHIVVSYCLRIIHSDALNLFVFAMRSDSSAIALSCIAFICPIPGILRSSS